MLSFQAPNQARPIWGQPRVNVHRLTACCATSHQGLTLVHYSASRKRFEWDKRRLGGVWGVRMAGVEGLFRRLGDVLGVRNGSG